MASTISAGTTAGTALNFTADTSGSLQFKTNNGVTAMTIDTSQNVTYANGVTFSGVIAGNGSGITAINASNVTSGTIANARTTAASANGASTIVLRDTNGSFAGNVGTFTSVSGNGSALTAINASNVSSGTIATARLGTGTADSTTFLRGDGTWNAPAGGVTSLNGQTGAITNTALDAIGSYICAINSSAAPAVVPGTQVISSTSPGTTIAGSTLRYGYTLLSVNDPLSYQGLAAGYYKTSGTTYGGGGSSLSGTWRCMGYEIRITSESCGASYTWFPGLWVRIS